MLTKFNKIAPQVYVLPVNESLDNDSTIKLLTPKTIIMKKVSKVNGNTEYAKAAAIETTVKGVNILFGTAHFVFQTAADLTCYTEAKIVHSLKSHEASIEELMKQRRASTIIAQEQVMAIPGEAKRRWLASQAYIKREQESGRMQVAK